MAFISVKKFQIFQNIDIIVRSISLYEIDQILQQKAKANLSEDPQEIQELIQKNLSIEYHEFKDVFSKAKSNELLSYWTYDHKIILKAP